VQGPLSIVSTTEELLEWKNSSSGLENRDYSRGIRHADHATSLYPQKLELTSPACGSSSVGIVHSRTYATEFSFLFFRIERMLIRTFCLVLVFGTHARIFSRCFHFDPAYTHTRSTYIYIHIVQEDSIRKTTFSQTEVEVKKHKAIPITDHEGHKVVRRRGSHTV
jgi:hypothetical protein